jgi:hypothetical protein
VGGLAQTLMMGSVPEIISIQPPSSS